MVQDVGNLGFLWAVGICGQDGVQKWERIGILGHLPSDGVKRDPVDDKENNVSDSNAMNGKENWARLVNEFGMPSELGWYGSWFVVTRVKAGDVAYSVHPGRGLECGQVM